MSGVSGPVAAPGRRVFSAARRRDPLTILTSNPLSRELHVIVLWITSLSLAKTSISYSIPDFHYISSDAQTFDFCACPQCLCWGRPKHHEDIRPARPPRRRWSRTHSACCGNIASINLISLVLFGYERTRARRNIATLLFLLISSPYTTYRILVPIKLHLIKHTRTTLPPCRQYRILGTRSGPACTLRPHAWAVFWPAR